jgi:hypothetical protein
VHNLTHAGREAVAAFVGAVTEAAVRTVRAMAGSDVRPQTWGDHLESLSVLGELISAETVAAVSADLRTPEG